MSADPDTLAAERILRSLADAGGIEFVSSRGAAALADAAAVALLRHDAAPDRATRFADWLLDQVEVAELYADNEGLATLLRQEWDSRGDAQARVARNVELEAELVANPDELANYVIYGDWLQGQGDPYGEWITRQVAAAAPDATASTKRKAAAYLHAEAPRLLGPLAEYVGTTIHLDWQLGFVRRARVAKLPDDDEGYEGPILLRWLLEHRVSIVMRALELESLERHSSTRNVSQQLRSMVELLIERRPPLLDSLSLARGQLGELARLTSAFPDLRELSVRGCQVRLQPLVLPRLRKLEVEVGWTSGVTALALFASELPELESLALFNEGAFDREAAAAMLAGEQFAKLRHLRARGDFELLERLVGSPLLARLETLDLSGGALGDDAAAILLRHRARFAHLRRLVLDGNFVGDASATELLAAFGDDVVSVAEQRAGRRDDDEDDDEYYDDAME